MKRVIIAATVLAATASARPAKRQSEDVSPCLTYYCPIWAACNATTVHSGKCVEAGMVCAASPAFPSALSIRGAAADSRQNLCTVCHDYLSHPKCQGFAPVPCGDENASNPTTAIPSSMTIAGPSSATSVVSPDTTTVVGS